jgi:hypothetical protein
MSATNITHETPTRGPAKPLPYVISGVLLLAAVVFPLLVPMYAHDEPRFFGFPFFFWYQMLWVPICAVLIGIAYWLMAAEDKRRRAVLKEPAIHRGKHDAGGEPQ